MGTFRKSTQKDCIVHKKIGDKTITMAYDPIHKDAKRLAEQRLADTEAEYLDALEILDTGAYVIADELAHRHAISEQIRQEICASCGSRNLKERKGRMRVFGGWFWTDSKPSPYKHCDTCGHDQEANSYRYKDDETFAYEAERRVQRAQKLVDKYSAGATAESPKQTKPERAGL